MLSNLRVFMLSFLVREHIGLHVPDKLEYNQSTPLSKYQHLFSLQSSSYISSDNDKENLNCRLLSAVLLHKMLRQG